MYADIICFCQEACKLFSTKRKGVRYKLSVIRDLFWTPFDVRFSSLLTRLTKHEELYELELSLADREELILHYQKFDKELADTEEYRRLQSHVARKEGELALRARIRELKKWISAPDYMELYEREKANLKPDTGQWLLKNPTYCSWSDGSSGLEAPGSSSRDFASRVLTIQGSPGYGKTVLSTLLIEDLGLD